jgi:hypothetical protein
MASFHHRIKSGKKGSAAEHAAYISRHGKYDKHEDLVASGYGNMPPWAKDDPELFWKMGDQYERANGAVYREHEIALPSELTSDQLLELVNELVPPLIGDKPHQYAVHQPTSSLEGLANTHLHLMYSDRKPDGVDRSPEQTFSRYNPTHPERGGCRKESGGKNRMELRNQVIETRRKSAELQNAALKKYGHEERVDHRSLKQRGIDRKPERHLGQARIRKMSAADKKAYVQERRKK